MNYQGTCSGSGVSFLLGYRLLTYCSLTHLKSKLSGVSRMKALIPNGLVWAFTSGPNYFPKSPFPNIFTLVGTISTYRFGEDRNIQFIQGMSLFVWGQPEGEGEALFSGSFIRRPCQKKEKLLCLSGKHSQTQTSKEGPGSHLTCEEVGGWVSCLPDSQNYTQLLSSLSQACPLEISPSTCVIT